MTTISCVRSSSDHKTTQIILRKAKRVNSCRKVCNEIRMSSRYLAVIGRTARYAKSDVSARTNSIDPRYLSELTAHIHSTSYMCALSPCMQVSY